MKKIFNVLLVVVMAIVTFATFGILPTFVKLVWIIAFCLFWFGRKFIQENLISYLQSHTVNPDGNTGRMSGFFAQIESFIWVTDSGEKTGTDAWKYKRSPNHESLKAIRHLISLLILVIFIGIPLLISGIISLIGGILGGIGGFFTMLGEDLTFVNGVGFFILGIGEILATLFALAMLLLCFTKRKDIFCSPHIIIDVFGKSITAKTLMWITAISILVQRLVSWFYFEYSFTKAISEIVSVAVIIIAIVGFSFIKKSIKKRRSRMIFEAPEEEPFEE